MVPEHNFTDAMTLDEQVGQLMVTGFYGTTAPTEIVELIQRQHVGGIILFSRNVQDTQQLLELTSHLQSIAREAGHRYPLLITIDQENGVVRRLGPGATTFPGNMAQGAIGSLQIVHDIALATGQELKALGINMNLAPVVDVNNNPANPVIGVRSFGEDPHKVAQFSVAAVQGYHDAGIITCLKHFPGHGDTAVDSHYALPTIPYTLEHLERVELVPFRAAIAAGADSVMTAHISFPHLMQHDEVAATLSSSILRGLLREKLGFQGVIISDCLEMKAISETIGVARGAVQALIAGNDLVLISHHYSLQMSGIEAIHTALKRGEIPPATVMQAAERVHMLKSRYLSWDNLPESMIVPEQVGGTAHQMLSTHAYELAVTLVRDAHIPLQLTATQRLLVIYPSGEAATLVADRSHSGAGFVASLRRHHANVDGVAISLNPTEAEREHILQQAAQADGIIMLSMNANLHLLQAGLMLSLIATGKPVIGIAVHNPYDLAAFPDLPTYLATYEYTQPALEAATRILFGQIQQSGHLPVTLPGM